MYIISLCNGNKTPACKGVLCVIIVLSLFFTQCKKTDSPTSDYPGLWQKVNTPYFGNPLDIKFTSADTGYILGAKNSDDSVYNILIKTYNGGQTWQSIAYTNHTFLTDTSGGVMGGIYVSPFNSNIIYSGRTNVIRSADGGLHWQIINAINATGFPAYFFDPQNGISANVWGMSITDDGGNTWSKVLSNASINDLQFKSRETGYASSGAISYGFMGGYFSNGAILKTGDGGKTWQFLSYPGFIKDNNTGPGVFGMSFTDENTGFIYIIDGAGDDAFSSSGIYKTTNAGNSWTMINSNIIQKYSYVNSFYMINETDGFLSSDKGIFRTTDGCKSWNNEQKGTISLLTFPDAHTGYAIDTSGTVLKRIF